MVEGIGPPAQSELFRLKTCPGCDYSLETLPAEGMCPECGRRYDQRFIVLTGRGRGNWDSATGGTWRGMVRESVWVLVLCWLFTKGRRSFSSLYLLAWGAIAAIALGAHLYVRLFAAREPRMQLWLSPEGVGQISSTPEGRRAQSIAGSMSLLFIPVVIAGIFVGDGGRFGMIVMPVLVALLFVVPIVWAWWRVPREDEDGVNYVPGQWPWEAIERIRIERASGGRMRFRCEVVRMWGRVVVRKDWVIDIEVECPANVAESLARQVAEWCPKLDMTGA